MPREGTCFCSIWLSKMGFRNHWNLDQVWSCHLNPSDSPQETFQWAMISRWQLRAQSDKKQKQNRVSFFQSLIILSVILLFLLIFLNPPDILSFFWSAPKHFFYSIQLHFTVWPTGLTRIWHGFGSFHYFPGPRGTLLRR